MVRSMYAGVSGMRTHQTRMDTIGNNIANVNTYGFKSARATFRDIYYQNISSASGPTAAQGGQNPSEVGYGAQVGSVDLMMGRSTFTMTDQTMDMAIDGDGFFQVMDAAGNTYYTRAGVLNFDAAGNLVDMQGNFVLGVNGDPSGRTSGSERITVTLPPVTPKPGTVTTSINGKDYTITASNATADSNVNFNFTALTDMTDGVKAQATVTATGIVVNLNANEKFANWGEVNAAVNDAIVKANGGKQHAGGTYTISYSGEASGDPFLPANMPAVGYLTGAQLCSNDYGIAYGKADFVNSGPWFGGLMPSGSVGTEFSGDGAIDNFKCEYDVTDPANPKYVVSMTVGGQTYQGEIDSTRTSPNKFNLYNTSGNVNDYIEMSRPSFKTINDAWYTANGYAGTKAQYSYASGTAQTAAGSTLSIADPAINGGTPITFPIDGTGDYASQLNALVTAINSNTDLSAVYTASNDGGKLKLVAKNVGAHSTTITATGGFLGAADGANTNGTNARLTPVGDGSDDFTPVTNAQLGGADAKASPSGPSYAMGLSSTSMTLRGGTAASGQQTLADMTGISIGGNGLIVGLDSQGTEITIGRIDIVTFANSAGLTQAGSSTYMESKNSGTPKVTQPGMGGAGKLVGGTLELSNVDLSREFSDMITTQRGYQANSRIITVSDTMLEELINLKR